MGVPLGAVVGWFDGAAEGATVANAFVALTVGATVGARVGAVVGDEVATHDVELSLELTKPSRHTQSAEELAGSGTHIVDAGSHAWFPSA